MPDKPARATAMGGAAASASRPGPVIVARAVRLSGSAEADVGAGLRRANWLTTAWRLLLEPAQHPWLPSWRMGRASATRAVAGLLLVLLLCAWMLSGCGTASVSAPRLTLEKPPGATLCETVKSPRQELKVVSGSEKFVVSYDGVPTSAGASARLLIQPEKARAVAIVKRGEQALPNGPFEASGPILELTIEPAGGKWPDLSPLSVSLEVSASSGQAEAMGAVVKAAADDLLRVERRFEQQALRPAGGATESLAAKGDELEKAGCKAESIRTALDKAKSAVDALDAVRAALYADNRDGVAEGEAARKALSDASDAVTAAARDAGAKVEWPKLEQGPDAPYRFTAEHLAQLERIGKELKSAPDQQAASLWLTFALAPDGKVDERRRRLPALRSLDDAIARQQWKTVARGQPLPVQLPSADSGRDWMKACSGLLAQHPAEDAEATRGAFALRLQAAPARTAANTCYGDRSSAAVPDQAAADHQVREWLAMQKAIVVRAPEQLAAANAKAQCARRLLCGEPTVDVGPIFFVDPGESLGPVRDRLREVREATPEGEGLDPAIRAELRAGASSLVCETVDDHKLPNMVKSLSQYKRLFDNARDVLQWAPPDLPCKLTGAKLRARFRQRWLELLSRAGLDDRLCPNRSGICPQRIAERVQSLFGLPKGRLASPVKEGTSLDYPPPFGFIRPFVEKLRRCKMCEELDDVRRGIPGDDLAGEECPVEADEEAVQTSIEIGPPGEVQSVDLPGCDLSVPTKLKLKLKRGAGRVVSVVSPKPFKLNNTAVADKRLHAQLGWAYVRTGDVDDQQLFAGREARILPSEPGQKFYFLSLRTAAY